MPTFTFLVPATIAVTVQQRYADPEHPGDLDAAREVVGRLQAVPMAWEGYGATITELSVNTGTDDVQTVRVDGVEMEEPHACDNCGTIYDEATGDGWAGLCPSCADGDETQEV